MKIAKPLAIASALVLSTVGMVQQSEASECGLSCCIAAGVDGVGSATGLTLSLQYDTMLMKTNRQSTSKISPQQIISNNLAARAMGSMYAVSTKMTMQKIVANMAYRMDEDNVFMLTVPYIINDMEMMMGMKMGGGIRYSNSTMDTIQGLGDVTAMYLRDVYKDTDIRTRERLTLGLGIKAPTGKSKARNRRGDLVHMMMQAGTDSWDAFLVANGTFAFGEHEDGGAQWMLSPSASYHATTRNSLGYKVGDRLNADLSARYRITSKFNVKLDVNSVYSQKDDTDGTIDPTSGKIAYQNVNGNVLDNVANTGLASVFISPGFQWIAADGLILSGEYRMPVYQNVRGIQQVTDHWFFLRATTYF